MYSLKKKMAVALSGVLTLAMLAPAAAVPNVAKAAEADTSLGFTAQAGTEIITITDANKVTVDTLNVKNGKVKSSDVYKATKKDESKAIEIDLSYLNGKESKLEIYEDSAKKLTVSVAAQDKTVKVKYDAEKSSIAFTKGERKDTNYNVVIGSEETEYEAATGNMNGVSSAAFFAKYLTKGVTGYVYYDAVVCTGTSIIGTNKEDIEVKTVETVQIQPVSKQAKFKIPAKKKGPKIAFDIETLSFKLPKGCEYTITQGEGDDAKVASCGSATEARSVSLINPDTSKDQSISDAAFNISASKTSIELKKSATTKAPESKVTELVLPTQATITTATAITKGGIYYEAKLNAKKTKQTGITVKNDSQVDYQVAVTNKEEKDLDLLAKGSDKVKWKTVKAGKTVSYTTKQAEGKYVVYRIKGSKKTKDKEMVLPSNFIYDEGKVTVKAAPGETLNASLAISGSAIDTNASKTAITATLSSETNKLYYAVEDSKPAKAPGIDAKISEFSSTAKEAKTPDAVISGKEVKIEVSAKVGQFVNAYEVDANNCIVAYKSLEVSATNAQ